MVKINCGDIIFVHGKGLISHLIEFFDKGKYSHVAMGYDDNGKIIESQYFENTHIIQNPYPTNQVKILSLNLTDDMKHKLKDFAPNYLKEKYDFKQILGIFLHDLWSRLNTNDTWNNPKELICSELIVDLLYDIGYLNGNQKQMLRDVTPNLLYDYLIHIDACKQVN